VVVLIFLSPTSRDLRLPSNSSPVIN